MSAKTGIRRAMLARKAMGTFKTVIHTKKKNNFTNSGIPLGRENFGKDFGKLWAGLDCNRRS